jgi:branched-chain amino acid transport system ATP-binding protein
LRPISEERTPLLDVHKIAVAYGDIPILEGVSLKVQGNQVVSVLGANGAGKTTLLRAISGLLHPFSGEITFLDIPITRLECYQIVNLGLVRVPEGRKIFPSLTVLENLELGSYPSKAKAMRKETLANVYGLFPLLRERKSQVAGTLSGGEQQMLAIARGLMSVPELLMLDEPSLGLSPLLVKSIFDIIKQISHHGTTVLLVEQNIYHSLLLSDQGYVMENGRIVLEGTGKELLESDHVRRAYLGI